MGTLQVLGDGIRLARSVPDFVRYRRLQERFGFDPWHVKSPYPRRPYKARVVAMIDGFKPDTVVEIGCGLGEIVSRSTALHRFGFDQDAAVVAAAKYLNGSCTTFRTGDLRKPAEIADIVGRPIDVLVAVNWPHILPFGDIEKSVAGLAAHQPVSILVIDTIRRERPCYEHYHTLGDIARLGKVVMSVPGGDGIRDIHAVRLSVTT